MADERDRKLSEHYRELEPMEPPAALDQAILAAARRAADKPHAPLVAPAGRHRWYYGLAAAAVLFFAVALTLHIERERPDSEADGAAPTPKLRLERELRGVIKPAPQPESQAAAKPETPLPGFAPDPAPRSEAKPAVPAARAPARRLRQADELLRQEESARPAPAETRARSDIAQRNAAAPAAAPTALPENPERWLERIAELRSRGRHAEADKELAEFRKVYPDYRLSEVMRERVEGR
jgi:hypothetical protein